MKIIASLLATCLLICCVNTAGAQGNSLLWKISGNGLAAPSYLYGTMHTKDPRVFRLADSVLAVFEACDAFAMEVILDDASKENIFQDLFMDTSYSLKKLLTPEQYDSVDLYCRKNTGQSIKNYENLKPIYTAAILSQSMSGSSDSAGNQQPYFLDEYFQHLAKDQQKSVQGLETIGEQMHVFNVLSYSHQADLLMETIRKSPDNAQSYDQMVRHYLDNDLVKMMSFENDFSLPDSLYDGLITERNHRMAQRIDTMIRKQTTFIAVGAGHLGETEGLVNLLRDKGYTVLPVIPTYNSYLPEGWYRKISSRGKFTAEFPALPIVSVHKINSGDVVHYSSKANASNFESQPYDLYVSNGRQDSVLQQVLQHHYKMTPHLEVLSPDQANFNKYSFSLETTDKMHCSGLCYEKDNRVYVLLYTYKRKVNKEVRNRFFSTFQLWD